MEEKCCVTTVNGSVAITQDQDYVLVSVIAAEELIKDIARAIGDIREQEECLGG